MEKSKTTLNTILSQVKELERIDHFRLGTIVKLDAENNRIWVDYDGNPLEKPVLAALGTPWVNREELTRFINKIDSVKLDFMEGNPARPVIRDLFFSIKELNSSNSDLLEEDTLTVKASEIVFEATRQITIRCGNTQTIFKAEKSEIIQEADDIKSNGRKNNKIKGGSILLN